MMDSFSFINARMCLYCFSMAAADSCGEEDKGHCNHRLIGNEEEKPQINGPSNALGFFTAIRSVLTSLYVQDHPMYSSVHYT